LQRIHAFDVRSALAELQVTEAYYLKEFQVWDLGFSELVRQVYIHCAERGQLLERLRERFVGFYETRQKLFQYVLKGYQEREETGGKSIQARRI
jgi:hypothetical protein